MALVVEDGTGLPNAESYISVADADTYHGGLATSDEWTALTVLQKEAALRLATSYMDGAYRWKGSIVRATQALDWPRQDVVDDEGRQIAENAVPIAVREACAELALQNHRQALNQSTTLSGVVRRQRVGPIEREFFEAGQQSVRTTVHGGDRQFDYVDNLLRPYIVLVTTPADNTGQASDGTSYIVPVERGL